MRKQDEIEIRAFKHGTRSTRNDTEVTLFFLDCDAILAAAQPLNIFFLLLSVSSSSFQHFISPYESLEAVIIAAYVSTRLFGHPNTLVNLLGSRKNKLPFLVTEGLQSVIPN